ncbi:MAG: class I SAM-dependent methyltransferase [Limisphaerales bacterium]
MSEVGQRIAGEIRDRGAITFARFMELALYCPNSGYYEKEEDIIGRRGDYYTSVSVGSLFGELLAFQVAGWLQERLGVNAQRQQPSRSGKGREKNQVMQIVEAGAHGGDLARDILGWLRQHRPSLFQSLEYWIMEPSERRRNRQQQNLREFSHKVRWMADTAGLTGRSDPEFHPPHSPGFQGVIFSNELLDAMPVHRLGWDAKARIWFEWGVTLQAGQFVWTRIFDGGRGNRDQHYIDRISSSHFQLPVENGLLDVLPDGFTTELCPAAEEWWRTAATVLECGKLVAIDYGLSADEFFVPERKEGTVRAYHHHQPSSNVLTNPGEQDITAHVNFTAIRNAGESAGLRTDSFLTQAQFLTSIAERSWKHEGSFGEWTAERTRQFQTLTYPDHLGRSFRVLVQSRGL